MSRRPRIDVPSTQDDQLPLRSIVATSLACLALGLGVAYGMTGGDRPSAAAIEPSDLAPSASIEAEPAAPEPAPPEPAPPEPAPTEPAPTEPAPIGALSAPSPASAADAAISPVSEPAAAPATAAVAEPAPEPAPDPTAALEPDPAPAPQPAASAPDPTPQPALQSRRLRIEPGVFAYLRCEGVPKRRGPYPCPRDRELEARMRTIVEALPTCREAHAIPRGRSFDLRIELGAGGAVNDLLVKAPNDAAERAVRACAGPALRKERTALKTTRMIVSMRFKAH